MPTCQDLLDRLLPYPVLISPIRNLLRGTPNTRGLSAHAAGWSAGNEPVPHCAGESRCQAEHREQPWVAIWWWWRCGWEETATGRRWRRPWDRRGCAVTAAQIRSCEWQLRPGKADQRPNLNLVLYIATRSNGTADAQNATQRDATSSSGNEAAGGSRRRAGAPETP